MAGDALRKEPEALNLCMDIRLRTRTASANITDDYRKLVRRVAGSTRRRGVPFKQVYSNRGVLYTMASKGLVAGDGIESLVNLRPSDDVTSKMVETGPLTRRWVPILTRQLSICTNANLSGEKST